MMGCDDISQHNNIVCVFACACMHLCLCFVHACMHANMDVHTLLCKYVHMYVCIYVSVCMHMCLGRCMYHQYIRLYIYPGVCKCKKVIYFNTLTLLLFHSFNFRVT